MALIQTFSPFPHSKKGDPMQADEMFEKQVSILIWILRQKEEIMNQNSHSLSMWDLKVLLKMIHLIQQVHTYQTNDNTLYSVNSWLEIKTMSLIGPTSFTPQELASPVGFST